MKTHTKLITTGLLVTLSMNLSAYNHIDSHTGHQMNTLDSDTKPVITTTDNNIPNIAVTQDGLNVKDNIDKATGIRLQALLDWHNASPGPIDGKWGENTVKALKAYQAMIGVEQTGELTDELWQSLLQNFQTKPVFVNYYITDADMKTKVAILPNTAVQKSKRAGMYYESIAEALAERFHMHIDLFKSLNGSTFKSGDIITVYNTSRPSLSSIDHLVANKNAETLYAYSKNKLVAMYPASYGNVRTPSPSGTHRVTVKVYEPKYTYTSDAGKKYLLPPGPNSPVGNVWLGLSKKGYGIHGSPLPERISRQTSAGCVRLTNWDALSLYGAIKKGATVQFQ